MTESYDLSDIGKKPGAQAPRTPKGARTRDGKFPRKLSLEVSMKLSLEVS